MTHPTDLLPDYLLGNLPGDEIVKLERHLERCAACREELARLSAPLVALSEAVPQVAPPDSVWEGLSARFTTLANSEGKQMLEPPQGQADFKVPYSWLMAACIAMLCLGASLYWGYQNYEAYQQVQAETRQVTNFLARSQVQHVALENIIGSERTESPGSVLLAREGKALFILADIPPGGRTYQAWGHLSSDWDPERGEELTSLLTSQRNIFAVDGAGFASLYLSLEPAGGSPQPTQPLSKVSLLNARPSGLLEIGSPPPGLIQRRENVIVSGTVAEAVTSLRYTLNGGGETQVTFVNNRFSFTLTGLQEGENVIAITATSADDTVVEEVTVVYAPEQ